MDYDDGGVYVEGSNITGSILRIITKEGKPEAIKLWATVEGGLLKYFRAKPRNYDERPIGYANLDGSTMSEVDGMVGFAEVSIDAKKIFTITITEPGIEESLTFGFAKELQAQNWRNVLKQAIRGKSFPPVYLDHGKRKGGEASSVTNSLKETAEFPSKTGSMKKKAVGKKKVLYRTWKERYFKLQAGELRYYKDKSFKTSTLKGTVDLSTCPGKAVVTGSPEKITVTIPLPKNLSLICNCKTEVEAIDWMDLINESIVTARSLKKRASNASGRVKRRTVIVNDTGDDHTAPPQVPKWDKSKDTVATLSKALGSHFLFNTAPDFGKLLDSLQPLEAQAGDCVIWEGDAGDKFYILESGLCSVVKNSTVLSFQQTEGTAFGELALIHGAPRAASIRAIAPCKLWYVDRATFRHVLNEMENGLRETQKTFLRKISLFSELSDVVIMKIAEAMKTVEFKDGENIIKQGDAGEDFFMIKSGNVTVTQKIKGGVEKVLTKSTTGDYFGELALMKNTPRQANVIATGPVECFTLDRANFNEVLGPLEDVLNLHKGIHIMKKVKMLAENLSEQEMEQIARKLERKLYSDGERIIKQGDHGEHFFMIERGTVTISIDNTEVGSLTDSSDTPYFGEMALMSDDTRVASVIADGSVQIAYLTRNEFQALLGPMKDIIQREAQKRQDSNNILGNTIGRLGRAISNATSSARGASSRSSASSKGSNSNSNKVPFSALVEKRILGTGTFGTVKLMQDGRDGKGYAMKILRKQKIINMKQVPNVYSEREMMEILDYPLILRLAGTYQDSNSLYMLLDLVPGGELWALLHGEEKCLPTTSVGGLAPDHAKFYAANVLATLEHMHAKNVAYRDLKPENLVLDAEGYLKVIDLGFAKLIAPGEKSNTLCGTPEYLAPELVLSKGHSHAVDVWALGILIFELLTNDTPFEAEDATVMFSKISNPKPHLKKAMPKGIDKKSRKIIEKILDVNPVMRLGCKKKGMSEMWADPWFDGFTEDLISRKALNAPYVPPLSGPLDVFNFDDFEDDNVSSEDLETFSYSGPSEPFRQWGNKA
jgi:cGMP-dependent protein kinase